MHDVLRRAAVGLDAGFLNKGLLEHLAQFILLLSDVISTFVL